MQKLNIWYVVFSILLIGFGLFEVYTIFFPTLTLLLLILFPIYICIEIFNLFVRKIKIDKRVIFTWGCILLINLSIGFYMNYRADTMANEIIKATYEYKKKFDKMPCNILDIQIDHTQLDVMQKKFKFGPRFVYVCEKETLVFFYKGYLRDDKSWNSKKLKFDDVFD